MVYIHGGGGKISTLIGMPGSTGLFHKMIAQSGSLLRVGDHDSANKEAKTLMDKPGLAKPEDLQMVPAADLFTASSESPI
jgi:para-nitrobenzyl esterase